MAADQRPEANRPPDPNKNGQPEGEGGPDRPAQPAVDLKPYVPSSDFRRLKQLARASARPDRLTPLSTLTHTYRTNLKKKQNN